MNDKPVSGHKLALHENINEIDQEKKIKLMFIERVQRLKLDRVKGYPRCLEKEMAA